MTHDFVGLQYRRNRGWPWPDDSWGLTPMYGSDGWCPSCGVPRRQQSGSLVLKRSGFAKGVVGAWVPNWQFDVICVEWAIAEVVAQRFSVELREVVWHGASPGVASQLVVPSVGDAWFDAEELGAAARTQHGIDGALCSECGVWRWMPLVFGYLPPLRIDLASVSVDVVASPEWFGDGMKAFRQILVRRPLAELLLQESPRDFLVNDLG